MKKKDKDLKFSICIPTYNGGLWIKETLRSILNQKFDNLEIIIVDDASTDNTLEVIKEIKDKRIKIFRNEKNLGYSLNLEECRKHAVGNIIFLMGQDDILGEDALLATYNAFNLSDNIGAVTRPYFWFEEETIKPVRAKIQLNPKKDTIVKITDPYYKVRHVFDTLDQLSGLAYRRKFIDLPFHKDVFPCHVYPFASIFKKHPIVFLKDYNLAVRICSSQTRSLPTIYSKSPMQSWKEMFDHVFPEKEFNGLRNYMIKEFVGLNYIGLLQIRGYGSFDYFIREVKLLIKYRKENLFNIYFWLVFFLCLLLPKFVLTRFVDWYKRQIYSKHFKNIKFKPCLN